MIEAEIRDPFKRVDEKRWTEMDGCRILFSIFIARLHALKYDHARITVIQHVYRNC